MQAKQQMTQLRNFYLLSSPPGKLYEAVKFRSLSSNTDSEMFYDNHMQEIKK